jgi:enoyl-CoA hydratase
MSEPSVLLAHEGALSILTINRPDALNALDAATLYALATAIGELAAKKPRCAVITGAGDKAFVAGADIAAMSSMTSEQALAFARLGQSTFAAIEALSFPVIAAVNGFALGGGCELALACDFVYASDKAKLGQPEVKLGILPGFGGSQRLARRIGAGMARELVYTGRMIGPEEALRIGLVNAVAPRRELIDRVRETAALIAQNGPGAVAHAKRVMLEGAALPLGEAIELEAQAFAACFALHDQKEGMQAFLAKRPAAFEDR